MKYNEMIKKALNILANKEKYAYFYGAKGQVLTDAVMDALIKAEPKYFSKYTKAQLVDIKNYSRNKIGYDCSGFITAISNVGGSSTIQWNNCLLNPSIQYGMCGSILHKAGHIGVDIGYGLFLHFPSEGKTCTMQRIADYDWEQSGLLKSIDYTGSSCI